MNIPTQNPFIVAENQIVTGRKELTDEAITDLIHEFHGEDSEIIAIGRGGNIGWIRVNCWIEDDFGDCWVWITNDTTEWQLVWSDWMINTYEVK
ncbi:hypothetical protein DRO03_07215 [Methanosarcinales archaeon]|nr:MAG: hypothetical protein DRO03_07215 [Methanosarcinales archaeon]